MMRQTAMGALAVVLLTGSLTGCAEYTTTGVPYEESTAAPVGAEESANPLAGTSWALTESSLSSQDLGSLGVTADFFDDQVSGQAPVNSYFADYAVQGTTISIAAIGTTKMAGTPKLMAAETAYLKLLAGVTSFDLQGDTLWLLSGDTQSLGFVPAAGAGTAADPQGGGTDAIETFAQSLVGQPVADAQAAAEAAGYTFRVTMVDGQSQAVTSDLREDRINAAVENGVVVTVTIG